MYYFVGCGHFNFMEVKTVYKKYPIKIRLKNIIFRFLLYLEQLFRLLSFGRILPAFATSTRSVQTPNVGEPLQTQRRTRRTKLQMQEEYDQMTTAEKAVRDRAKTGFRKASARATVRNTARPNYLIFYQFSPINLIF